MRIAIIGAGGVGGYFGARLQQAGADVHFVARGSHLAAMRRDGLTVESPLGDIHLPKVNATETPADIGPADMVWLSVKLWDMDGAVKSMRPLIGPDTGIISFQNGVQKDDILRAAFGDTAVMGGVAYIATNIDRPGVIKHTGTMQRLIFGEYDGRRSKRAETLLDFSLRGGIDAELSDDVRKAIWEKFVFLVALSGSTTTMRETIGPIRSNPRSRRFLSELMRETVAVGRALGVALPADFADQRLAFVDTLPHEMTSSMHHDLKAGKRLEVSWLSGGVAQLGEKAGVPTPMNRAVWEILALSEAGAS
ncbi:MAG TPA: 2-dehydropantoate 2-reductase [Vicinamibacterales bacterium]|jgi:2-dehydropantoate 2-reductase|nr:2-dehydropantoate 2-reductase [Vicinamibacterales bacterium]